MPSFTTFYGINTTNISYTGSSPSNTIIFDNSNANIGNTPAAGAGKAYLSKSGVGGSKIVASVVGVPGTVESDNTGWLSIDVPQDGVLSYYIESTSGFGGVASVDSFFELETTFTTGRMLNTYEYGSLYENMTCMFGVSGLRTYIISNTQSGSVEISFGEYFYPALSAKLTCNGNTIDTGMLVYNLNVNPALVSLGYPAGTVPSSISLGSLQVVAGQDTIIEVLAPFNNFQVILGGTFTPSPPPLTSIAITPHISLSPGSIIAHCFVSLDTTYTKDINVQFDLVLRDASPSIIKTGIVVTVPAGQLISNVLVHKFDQSYSLVSPTARIQNVVVTEIDPVLGEVPFAGTTAVTPSFTVEPIKPMIVQQSETCCK